MSRYAAEVLGFHFAPIVLSIGLLFWVATNNRFCNFWIGMPSLVLFLSLYAGAMYAFRWLPLDELLQRIKK